MIFQADKRHNCNDLKRKKAEPKPCLLVNNGHQIGKIQGAYRVHPGAKKNLDGFDFNIIFFIFGKAITV